LTNHSEAKELTNSRAIIFGILFGFLGIGLLLFSGYAEVHEWKISASMLRELGAFATISVVLGLWWEIAGRRKYTDELFAKIGMARDLGTAGISAITTSFKDDRIDWTSYFAHSTRLDMWVSYASTWRNHNIDKIKDLVGRKDSKIRIVLPDPENEEVLQQLASRFGQKADELRKNIRQAVTEYRGLATQAEKIEIYFSPKVPLYTFYVFNNVAVLAFYNHSDGKLPVPTFVCTNGGTLFQYQVNEFAALLSGARRAE